MKSILAAGVFALVLIPVAAVCEEREASLSEATGVDSFVAREPGVGFSSLVSVTRLRFDGTFDILKAGVGFGASWKASSSRYPFEAGLYLVPQFGTSADGMAQGSVALNAHVTFFKAFGLGIGWDAWRTGTGFTSGMNKETLFLTLAYGLTNENAAGR